jgi:hypothetical protein
VWVNLQVDDNLNFELRAEARDKVEVVVDRPIISTTLYNKKGFAAMKMGEFLESPCCVSPRLVSFEIPQVR